MSTKSELEARISELEQENQLLRERLEHTNQLLDEAIKGLREWNEQFWSRYKLHEDDTVMGASDDKGTVSPEV